MKYLRGFVRFMLAVLLFALCVGARSEDFLIGACVRFGSGRDEPVQTLNMMRAAGITSFRAEAKWQDVERTKGVFKFPDNLKWVEQAINLGVTNGIKPLIILDYGNKLYNTSFPITDDEQAAFVRYAEFIGTYFKGRVKYYEVWNEWNSRGKAEDYTRLLKKVYSALKKIDPSAVILGGAVEGAGPTTFIETMLREGAAGAMDGLSIHPYVFWRGPQGTPEALLRYVENLQENVVQKATGGKTIPIYITEAGWPDNTGEMGIEQERVGDYLSRTLLLLRTLPYVRGLWWYAFTNDGDDNSTREKHFGLVSRKFSPKPAYLSLQQTAELASKATFVERLPSEPALWALKFRKPDNSELVITWHTKSRGRWNFDVDGPGASSNRVKTRRIGKDKDQQNLTMAETTDTNAQSVEIDGTPLLMDSDKGTISVKRITKIQ